MSETTRIGLLSFPCTTCGAEVGEPCRALTSERVTEAHAARFEAEGAYYREKVPCALCGTLVMRSYLSPSGICTGCSA